MSTGMFDLPELLDLGLPPSPLSPDRARTARRQAAIDAGRHPLTGMLLHPAAVPEECFPDAPKGRPFTCGSCSHRVLIGWHGKSYPKCDLFTITHGSATDVRGWWPACPLYQPGNAALSRDAARWAPEVTS